MSLTDDFLAHRLAPSAFTHRAHVEVAWTLLKRLTFGNALREFQVGVQELATRAGAPEKYHVTITRALMHIIKADQNQDSSGSWCDYLFSKPRVLDDAKALLLRHYSEARLTSEQARLQWCEPDRLPLPAIKISVPNRTAIEMPGVSDPC